MKKRGLEGEMSQEKRAKFRIGQVVRLDTDFYEGERKGQKYQRIVRRFAWPQYPKQPFGYEFLNGDSCNERWIKPLTGRERGDDRG